MQLAIWNYPPAEFAVSGFTSGWVPPPFEIVRHTIPECVQLLAAGRVDVAMVPTLTLLRDPDAYDVLPAVALSSWSYPYARLVLRHGLQGEIERLAFNPVAEQEAFLARLVLKEHYQRQPVMVPLEGASHLDLLRSDADAALIVGVDAPLLHSDALWLDLGQEWYELANYPMVWGFFATRKGEATPAVIRAIRNNVDAAEEQRALWVRAQETSAVLHAFFAEGLRLRFDDLVIASLTEFKQYLFYERVFEEMPDLPFVFLDENNDEGGADPLL